MEKMDSKTGGRSEMTRAPERLISSDESLPRPLCSVFHPRTTLRDLMILQSQPAE